MTKITAPTPYIRIRILDTNEKSIFSTSDFEKIIEINNALSEPFYVGRKIILFEKEYVIKEVQTELCQYTDNFNYGISLDKEIGKEIPYLAIIKIIVNKN